MFLAINIVFILLIIRLSLNSRFLNAVMSYRWRFLLNLQHAFFFVGFSLIAYFTGANYVDAPMLLFYVAFLLLVNAGVYYVVYGFLVPHYYLSNKYPVFMLYALLLFLVTALFRILLEPSLFGIGPDQTAANANYLYLVYSVQALVILTASFFGITKDKFLIEQDYEALGEQKEQIHLDLMKSKLSPHFLLNTLNNIYAKSFVPSQHVSASILQLSRLLQYVIYDSAATKIPLASEFSTMRSLEGLYRLKYNNDLMITFDIVETDALEMIEVPPAVFLTFFENALKHSGVGFQPGSFIHVSFRLEDHQLLFEIRNSILRKEMVAESTYKGLGNEAIMHILKKNYAPRFTLTSGAIDDCTYLTALKIDLQWEK